jgi:hypothetical protein
MSSSSNTLLLEPTGETPENHLAAPENHPQALAAPENHPEASVSLPAAPGNRARRGNEISGELDPRNVIQGSRRSAHALALKQTNELIGYYLAFNTALNTVNTKPPHRDALPPPPRSWKQMLKH